MFLGLAYRLAVDNARLRRALAARDEQVDRLTARLRRLQSDVELLACCVPVDHRQDALALVRDRHRIEDGDIIAEVGDL